MKKFEIFCNYGVLGAENRNVYTYGAKHAAATCSDVMTVELPENEFFSIYETVTGALAVESSWGLPYDINDVLQGNDKPCFFAIDTDKKGHRVYLKEV